MLFAHLLSKTDVILICDTYRYYALNLSFLDAWLFFQQYPILNSKIILIFTLILMLPLLIILLKYQFKNFLNRKFNEAPLWLRIVTITLQIITLVYALILYTLIPYMKRLSGGSIQYGQASFAFYSIFDEFLLWINVAFFLGIIVAGVIRPFLDLTKDSAAFLNAWKNFSFWLHFAYPEGDFHPTHRRTLNFNTAGVSPEIKGITKKAKTKIKNYQNRIPSSSRSKLYLEKLYSECRGKIIELLNIKDKENDFKVEIYSSTSRALESAISRLPRPLTIILSPHEHYSEEAVSRWVAYQHPDVKIITIDFKPNQFQKRWHFQIDDIKNQLNTIIENKSNGNYLFIISEVSSLTGIAISVNNFINALLKLPWIKSLREANRFNFLIDGCHSLGNFSKPLDGGALNLNPNDVYIFSGHKWLLSPETIGVLVALEESSVFLQKPYDCWDENGLPQTTVSSTQIANFLSSLEFLREEERIKELMLNAELLRNMFLQEENEEFDVVANPSDQNIFTNLISIKPHSGKKWKTDNSKDQLREYFATKDVFVEIFDKGDHHLWVRLTFPYFATPTDIKKLKKKICEAMENV